MNGRFAPFIADGSVAAAAAEGKCASRRRDEAATGRTASLLKVINQEGDKPCVRYC